MANKNTYEVTIRVRLDSGSLPDDGRKVISHAEKIAARAVEQFQRISKQIEQFERGRGDAYRRALSEQGRLGNMIATERVKTERAVTQAVSAGERERTRAAQASAREFQRHQRENLRAAQVSARSAAREYEKELGQGLFGRLGRSASDAFKRNFSIGGIGGGGGGGVNHLSLSPVFNLPNKDILSQWLS